MHIPVLKTESLEALQLHPGEWYLDGTFGRGGHTGAMLATGAKVAAFDLDYDAIQYGQEVFAQEIASGNLVLIHGNFADLSRLLGEHGFAEHSFAGAMFDLGMSSGQIDDSGRGFTFQKDEPLDMRMNTDFGVTAADLLNALPETHLQALFVEYAQEPNARSISKAIVARREKAPFRTTQELADLVSKVKGGRRDGRLHPATKVFMALRMAVNTELDNLTVLLDQVLTWLRPQGRLVFLSFHEGEDREVKHRFRAWENAGKGVQVTKKPVIPNETEIQDNPRARSAKLRILEVL